MKIPKTLLFLLSALLFGVVTYDLDAQTRLSTAERQKKMQEAEDFFKKKKQELAARKSQEAALEVERGATRRTLASAGADAVDSQAKRAREKKVEDERAKALREKITRDASPEAKVALAKPVAVPPKARAVGAPPTGARGATAQLNNGNGAAASSAVDAGGVPVPSKRKVPNLVAGDEGGRKPGEVVITAKGGALFKDSDRLVIFEEEVHVDSPDFIIDCGLLQLWLEEDAVAQAKKPKNGDAKPATAPAPGVGGKPNTAKKPGETSIRKAIASKGTVTIQKKRADGTVDVGRSRRLEYDGRTGDIILKGRPQVQTGNKQIIAKAEETVIYLRGNGKDPEVVGPHETRLVPTKKQKP